MPKLGLVAKFNNEKAENNDMQKGMLIAVEKLSLKQHRKTLKKVACTRTSNKSFTKGRIQGKREQSYHIVFAGNCSCCKERTLISWEKVISRSRPAISEYLQTLRQNWNMLRCSHCRKVLDVSEIHLKNSSGKLIEVFRTGIQYYRPTNFTNISNSTKKTRAIIYRKSKSVFNSTSKDISDIEDFKPELIRKRECPVCGHAYEGSMICPKRVLHNVKKAVNHREISDKNAAIKEQLNQSHRESLRIGRSGDRIISELPRTNNDDWRLA